MLYVSGSLLLQVNLRCDSPASAPCSAHPDFPANSMNKKFTFSVFFLSSFRFVCLFSFRAKRNYITKRESFGIFTFLMFIYKMLFEYFCEKSSRHTHIYVFSVQNKKRKSWIFAHIETLWTFFFFFFFCKKRDRKQPMNKSKRTKMSPKPLPEKNPHKSEKENFSEKKKKQQNERKKKHKNPKYRLCNCLTNRSAEQWAGWDRLWVVTLVMTS